MYNSIPFKYLNSQYKYRLLIILITLIFNSLSLGSVKEGFREILFLLDFFSSDEDSVTVKISSKITNS